MQNTNIIRFGYDIPFHTICCCLNDKIKRIIISDITQIKNNILFKFFSIQSNNFLLRYRIIRIIQQFCTIKN
eukprot:UN16894